jgi:hypothetical protein
MEEFSQEMTAIDKTSVGMDKITPTIQPEGGSLPTAPKMLTSEAKNRQKTGKKQANTSVGVREEEEVGRRQKCLKLQIGVISMPATFKY